MGVIGTLRDRLQDGSDLLVERATGWGGGLADRHAGRTFAFLRERRPIVGTGAVTLVTRADDVREVLGDPVRFTAGLYGPKMEAVTGPFMLGVDDTGLARHDRAALDRAFRAQDLPVVAARTLTAARARVAAAGGELDVVRDLAEPVLVETIEAYLGVGGPDPATAAAWARAVFHELFINVGNLPGPRERALAAAASWRTRLDGQVAARRAALATGTPVGDVVLDRLLGAAGDGGPALRDIAVRHNLIGLVTGWIPTVSNALPRVVDELLDRPAQLAGAQAAARAGDHDLLARYVFEASRFNPQNFALLRLVAQDTTIAAGTERETRVRAGSTVYAATLSAMHDPRSVEAPAEFRIDRPPDDLLFGHGLHTCYGRHLVRAQLPVMVAALLEGRRLVRAGRLRFAGPFPSGLAVRLV